jgi:hypothetical protein
MKVLQISDVGAHNRNIGWLIGATSKRDGGEIWAIGLNQDAIERAQSGSFGDILGGLKCDDS